MKISGVYIDEYEGNTYKKSITSIMRNGLERQGLFTNTQWHTHPTVGYSRDAIENPSPGDLDYRNDSINKVLYYKFQILTREANYPYNVQKIDY